MELILLMMQKISALVLAIRFGKIHFTILEPFGWYNTILLISEKEHLFIKAIQDKPFFCNSSTVQQKLIKSSLTKSLLPIHLL